MTFIHLLTLVVCFADNKIPRAGLLPVSRIDWQRGRDSRTEGKEVLSSKARLMFVPRPRSERNTASRAVAGVAVLIGREEEDSRTEGKEVLSSKARLMFVSRPRSERNTASRAVAGVAVLIGRRKRIRVPKEKRCRRAKRD